MNYLQRRQLRKSLQKHCSNKFSNASKSKFNHENSLYYANKDNDENSNYLNHYESDHNSFNPTKTSWLNLNQDVEQYLGTRFKWPIPFYIQDDGKIIFNTNNKIDWVAKIYYDHEYLDYMHNMFGNFEISINVFDQKIALYACECESKFLFVYANELNKPVSLFDIGVAFSIFFKFINQNKLPLNKIFIERNETFDRFSFFNNDFFADYINKNISLNKVVIRNTENLIALKKNQIKSLNVILLQETWMLPSYWNIFNDCKFKYKDGKGRDIIYSSPREYIMKLMNKEFID